MLNNTKKSPNPADIMIGARIRTARLAVGMSQEKLGEAINLTFQQVQKYEKGTNRVGGSRMHQIATVLKQPVSFFFQDVEGEQAGSSTDVNDAITFLATKEGQQLVESFRAIRSAKARADVLRLIGTVSELAKAEEA